MNLLIKQNLFSSILSMYQYQLIKYDFIYLICALRKYCLNNNTCITINTIPDYITGTHSLIKHYH